jgi:hypothetical protein
MAEDLLPSRTLMGIPQSELERDPHGYSTRILQMITDLQKQQPQYRSGWWWIDNRHHIVWVTHRPRLNPQLAVVLRRMMNEHRIATTDGRYPCIYCGCVDAQPHDEQCPIPIAEKFYEAR